jgi:hypothetical protein
MKTACIRRLFLFARPFRGEVWLSDGTGTVDHLYNNCRGAIEPGRAGKRSIKSEPFR